MADQFKVKKGLAENLPETRENGSILFETDTGNMYVDSNNVRQQVQDNTRVSKSGDTMTGDLTIEGNIAATNFRNITDGTTLPSTGNEGDIFLLRNAGSLSIYDMLYPVGSIYMSVNNTDPSLIFGGTWERIQDRFLLAAGSTYTAGDTGGEATHTLTTDEMPSHSHTLWNGSYNWTGSQTANSPTLGAKQGTSLVVKTDAAGGGQSHNNMPPYIAVYMWKRLSLSDGSTQIIANGTPIDMTSTPYIVESGTSDIWTYRKWSNGDAECWGRKSYSGTTSTTWGSLYALPCDSPTYPFTFTSLPCVKRSITQSTGNSCWISGWSVESTSSSGTFALVRPTSSKLNVVVNFYVTGKWK